MEMQQIVERILSDAKAEAATIVQEAEKTAAKIQADASLRAKLRAKETEETMQAKRASILEKRAAAARLDSAKRLLGEKRKVVEAVYDEALSRLLELSKEDCLALVEKLLKNYAEAGDEIFFAKNFAYRSEVALLPVIQEKQLKISSETMALDGGLWLKGKISDKDLSFGSLLAADKDAYQAELAKELFK